jgi:hypothetical protein
VVQRCSRPKQDYSPEENYTVAQTTITNVPLCERTKPCHCGGTARYQKYCAAYVCEKCESHIGLTRCYCGWSALGGNGRQELEELGETIESEDY